MYSGSVNREEPSTMFKAMETDARGVGRSIRTFLPLERTASLGRQAKPLL